MQMAAVEMMMANLRNDVAMEVGKNEALSADLVAADALTAAERAAARGAIEAARIRREQDAVTLEALRADLAAADALAASLRAALAAADALAAAERAAVLAAMEAARIRREQDAANFTRLLREAELRGGAWKAVAVVGGG
jgi:hypothetical protein